MNAAHWHLMLNHLPIIGAAFALIIWLYAIWRNHPDIYRLALGLAILTGLATLPVYWSGEQGHEILHGLADFNHEMVETHEIWGTYMLYIMLASAALAIGCLLSLKRSNGLPSLFWKVGMASIFLITTGLGIYTGHLGGMVHHPEMRPGFVPHEAMEHHHP
jgi:hypothetical protein